MSTLYQTYLVYLTDQSLVSNYQAQFPNGLSIPPTLAAIQYNAPLGYIDNSFNQPPLTQILGGIGALPTDTLSIPIPAGFSVNSSFQIFTCPGAPASILQWVGYFLFAPIPPTGKNLPPLSLRRWAQGFEIPSATGEGTIAAIPNLCSRDASRTLDGRGFAYRSVSNQWFEYVVSPPSPGLVFSWERFYIRMRRTPSGGSDPIWSCLGSIEGFPAALLSVNQGNQLEFYNWGLSGPYPGTLLFTSPQQLALNVWYKIDIVFHFAYQIPNSNIIPGNFAVLIGGAPAVGYGNIGRYLQGTETPILGIDIPNASLGLGTVQNHISSNLGNVHTGSNGLECDMDDWIGARWAGRTDAPDFQFGSHVQLISPTGYGNNHNLTAWPADYRYLEVDPVAGADPLQGVVLSSTPSARLDATTNYVDTQIGCASFTTSVQNYVSPSVNVNLGFNVGESPSSTGFDITSSVAVTSGGNTTLFHSFTDGAFITAGNIGKNPSVNLVYVKDSGIGTHYLKSLQGTAEFMGSWGPEDNPFLLFPPRPGLHNAPYPKSAWANLFPSSQMPIAPVQVMTGTYTGNGTGQDITMPSPPHWIWIRPLVSADTNSGIHWWSSMCGTHGISDEIMRTNRMPLVQGLDDGTWKLSLAGFDPQSNAAGVTYRWVAFSDPGSRFLINGGFIHQAAGGTIVNPLADPLFVPIAAYLYLEVEGSSSANGHLYKGVAHTTGTASAVNVGATTPNVVTFGTGTISSLSALNAVNTGPQTSYALWRLLDAGGVTGPMAITSYTGDGTGARVVPLLLGGYAPIFVYICPHNTNGFFRDLSHTTNTSSDTNSGRTDLGPGITDISVINQVTVDGNLNSNGIVYEVFALSLKPIASVPLVPPIPADTGGWWASTNGFSGPATLITFPSNPKHGRQWSKLTPFAAGTSGMLGGSPGAAVVIRNRLIYAGDDYIVGTSSPTIRTFGPVADRLLSFLPSPVPASATLPIAIVSMMANGDLIYFSTFDSGTTSANFAGRVFSFDPLSLIMQEIGAGFSGGEVPYALAWHMGRLWCGTNKSDGTAGNVYFFRPNIDTNWTKDHIMAAGGVCSMASFQGQLYVGSDGVGGTFAKVLVRSTVGVYTTSDTGAGGAAQKNNGYLAMQVFNSNLYASYWNPDSPAIAIVRKLNGITNVWSTVYSNQLNPYIGMFISKGILYVVGGGDLLPASLAQTADGSTWTDSTAFLTGPGTETALPLFGSVGL